MNGELSLEFVRMVNEQPSKINKSRALEPENRGHNVRYGGASSCGVRGRRRKRHLRKVFARICLTAVATGMVIWFSGVLWDNLGLEEVVSSFFERTMEGAKGKGLPHPEWTEDFLTVNPYSRPGDTLPEVKDIFVHYTANPETNAVQNRSYFEQLKDTHERAASSHFIIGYEGDIRLCVPLDEVAYAVKTRNYDSMSIECCYINEDGSFTQETYDALIELLVWLLKEYDLTTDNILRHYDCGGKKCPLYYVNNEAEWEKLKADVAEKIK